jgi:quinol monooxygenase YgiN
VASELFVFTRCCAKESRQHSMAETIQEVLRPTRQEHGCLNIDAFRSTRDQGVFFIYSRWKDEAAFDRHLQLPHTVRFLESIQPLLAQTMEVTRSVLI